MRHALGGHHRYIINKCSGTPDKALLYVRQTLEHGWSRAMLLNFVDYDGFANIMIETDNFFICFPTK
ncbi:MAG: hypothetical protein LUI85_06825 [Bacteroides sp.]|nr:hypothetical protein [Bacteroides sp.]